jgi:cytochrome c-type biogenesis protein CcmE
MQTGGSVIVNGVHFDDTQAIIGADDSTNLPNTFLKDGMVVKVKGKRNDDGLNGTAEKIQVENEARGLIATIIGTDTFAVHGQTVQVTGATVFAGVTNLGALTTADKVEVHGLRDAAGVVQATRVEKVGLGAVDEVRGVITSITGTAGFGTFTIGSLSLTFSPTTTIVPPTSALGATSVGKLVQVHIGATNSATTVKFEDLAEAEFEPAEGQEFEVEGFVKTFTGASSSFTVNDQTVSLDSSVRFEGGLAGDLGLGVRVEAEGHLITGGVLVARKVTFKESFKIKTIATGTAPDLVAMGITVKTNSKTLNTAGGSNVEIRGFLNLDGTVTATKIKDGGGGSDFLQGLVTNINSGAHTFKIAGITVNAGGTGVTARPNDDNGSDTLTMDREAFFGSLSEGRTVVKAKGTFAAGTLAATEIEIE